MFVRSRYTLQRILRFHDTYTRGPNIQAHTCGPTGFKGLGFRVSHKERSFSSHALQLQCSGLLKGAY